jgi:ADP-heptose:LPS heptosyltransferase
MWSTARFQQVVDRLHGEGVCCVQGGAQLPGHWHPELKNAKSHVGTADPRGFLRLIYGADGVTCPVSFPMHVAAAFDKPCVVIAGGREPWWWEAYTNTRVRQFGEECAPVTVPHKFLHSIGQLDCCQSTGCWKTHVLPGVSETGDVSCQQPTDDM